MHHRSTADTQCLLKSSVVCVKDTETVELLLPAPPCLLDTVTNGGSAPEKANFLVISRRTAAADDDIEHSFVVSKRTAKEIFSNMYSA